MAINETTKRNSKRAPQTELVRRYHKIAGGLAILLGVVSLAITLTLLQSLEPSSAWRAMGVCWAILFGLAAAAGGWLLKGDRRALGALLIFWLIVAAGLLLRLFHVLQTGGEPVDQSICGMDAVAFSNLAAVVVLGGAAVLLGCLVATTPSGSRNRYGAMVSVAATAAVSVVIVINMISFAHPIQKDFESLGRFGLSERSAGIVEEVRDPMHISAIYSTAQLDADNAEQRAEKEKTQKYLSRVMELLNETHRLNPKIKVTNASSDAARMRLMSRLRKRHDKKTRPQEQMLQTILAKLPKVEKQLDAARRRWTEAPAEGFLAQWNMGSLMADSLDQTLKNLTDTQRDIRMELTSAPLPDYVAMLDKIVTYLKNCKQTIDMQTIFLKRLAMMPQTINKNAPAVRKSVDDSLSGLDEVLDILAKPDKNKPEKTLKKLASALETAAAKVHASAEKLDTLGGTDKRDVQILSAAKALMVEIRTPLGVANIKRSQMMDMIAKQLADLRTRTDLALKNANTDAQLRFLSQMVKPAEDLKGQLSDNKTALWKSLDQFRDVDKFSQTMFDLAQKNELFTLPGKLIDPLIAQADALPPGRTETLPPDLTGKNIVVIEADQKVEVVPFSAVWPTRQQPHPQALRAGEMKRFFNGDEAIASRILALSHDRPFARVLVTYFHPPTPPGIDPRQYQPQQSDIPPQILQWLGLRLHEANFRLEGWNLTDPYPQPKDDEKKKDDKNAKTQPAGGTAETPLPTVLLILPPPPPPIVRGMPVPMGGFGEQHMEKIRRAVNSGASAIFMGTMLQPQPVNFGRATPQDYRINEYLKEDWGIKLDTSFLIIAGIPSNVPGKYRIDPAKLQYLPMSDFTSQPIGKPLRGRHMTWPMICPITLEPKDKRPAGVSIQPILKIPRNMTNIWATQDIFGLGREAIHSEGNLVAPHYDKGDLHVPLLLAAAATRSSQENKTETKNISAARIVVLGVGRGMIDGYVNEPIRRIQDGFSTADPPRANLDLIVNSAYWLIGRENYIAAGPRRIEPVEAISEVAGISLWVFCVIVLPAGVLAAGSLVLMMRKR
jgi:hypothetical protein